jgi:hypothetical protein
MLTIPFVVKDELVSLLTSLRTELLANIRFKAKWA